MKEKHHSHLTWDKRIRIDSLVKAGVSVREISKIVEVHISTIYRELKRGIYSHTKTNLTTVEMYSPDISEQKYRKNLSNKGRNLKIGNDINYADFIENMIVDEKYSPEATLLFIEENKLDFSTKVSVKTLYNYIDKEVFYRLTNKDLPVKKNEKRTYRKIRKRSKVFGDSIELRPKEIEQRVTFGHWEMDCVIGKKEKGKVLLVLTERLTRKEIIRLLPEKKVERVLEALNRIERQLGFKKFKEIFKTITVDNGSEFAGGLDFESSCISNKKRTKLYYCHPYSSWERGSNENNNKLIRRHLPKGTEFNDLTDTVVKKIEEWVNYYPRRLFKGKNANYKYNIELNKLGIVI